jgi:ABC-type nickel/cobalt efflux system permease component RcnA
MIVDAQRAFQKKMAAALRALKTADAMSAALFLVGMSFLYGIFHAAGPGHGKAVISSYMLANKTTLRRGILIAVLAAMVQAISAVTLVGTLVLIMKSAGVEIRQMVHRFEMVSALLIAAAGLYFLTVHVRRQFVSQYTAGDCVAGSDEMPDPRTLEKKLALRELISIVFAVGIRPCTGAIIVLLFSLRLGILWAGIISAFVMAAGTAITVSALASLAVGSRELAARFAGSRWTDRFYDYATIAACLLVTVVGASLFWHSLGPMRPF